MSAGLQFTLDGSAGREAGRVLTPAQYIARIVAVQIGIALWNTGSM